MSEELLYFNGINGMSGTYGLRPMTGKDLASHIVEDSDIRPENLDALKEKLKQDTLNKIFDINATLLSESNASDLGQNAASQAAWLETLIRQLGAIPIDSLNNSISKGIVTRLLNKLIEQTSGSFESLTQELQVLSNIQSQKPSYRISWNDLLEALRNGLQALSASPSMPWSSLLRALNEWLGKSANEVSHLGAKEGVDLTDLAQTGWGIIFGAKNPLVPQIKEALSPLLNLRQSQAGKRFKIYEGGEGYRSGDSARTFMGRYNVRPTDPVDPDKAPYYVLIVGSPEEIPFSFMNQLDVQFAVGRIDFGDDLNAYTCYARSVVAAETGNFQLASKATFFGVANPDDQATNLSANRLVRPLYDSLKVHYTSWQMEALLKDEARKARLLRLMGGEETPAFLFTASHGMEFPKDDPKRRQVVHQGALLCQDWPGPNAWRGEVPHDFYLAGDDLTGEANLLGMIAFFFACYGAGTPLYDEYSKQAFKERREVIAECPFVAALPRAMLSLSRGGALAVIGHVERAWGASFLGPKQSEQIVVFESAIERLLKGHPVGSAMEYFNARYAALSTELSEQLESIEFGQQYDPYELAGMWTANNDARGYVVIGDPAVRLRVATPGQSPTQRPVIENKPGENSLMESPRTVPPAEIPVRKPDELTDEDWQKTPDAVRRYISKLQQK